MIINKHALRGVYSTLLAFSAMVCCGVSTPLNLMGQSNVDAEFIRDSLSKSNQLDEVRINRVKISRRQTSSTPLQILSGADLRRLNSLSVADAVRFFSGVQLKDYGGVGGLKTINVRSMGTNHTAVFYDGVQLGNAQNGQVDLGKFSLDNIEEIELYNGQKSSVFQSAKGFASGSSLYLNAVTPVFENGRSDHLTATLKSGSFGLINPALRWQKKISDRLYSAFSTAYKSADGRYQFHERNGVYDTTMVRENADIETLRLEGGLYGKMPDSSSWNVKVYFYKDQQGLPGAIVNNVYDFKQRLWNANFFVQGNYKKESGRFNILASAKYANDDSRYLDPNIVKDDGLTNNIYKQREWYLTLSSRYKIISLWDVVLSADYQRNTLDANLYRFPYPTRQTVWIALATEIRLNRLNIQANLLGTLVNDEVKQYYSAGDKSEISPTLMASWQPFGSKEFRLRTFYKHIFRMPTFNDLYYTFIGSTFLKPEYTRQYDLGFTYIKLFEGNWLSQISLQADAYYNQVKDKIVAVPGANLFRWSMQNLGRVEIKGLDVNLQSAWKVTNALRANAGFTYTHQRALNLTTLNYRQQIPYTPVHSGSVVAGLDWRRISFNYSYIYTGERHDQSANIPANYVLPWYTHDIALQYHKPFKHRNIRLSAEINNLLDQSYAVISNFPMPGRSYRFTLSYTH